MSRSLQRLLIHAAASSACGAGTCLLVKLGEPNPPVGYFGAAIVGLAYYVAYRIAVLKLAPRHVNHLGGFCLLLVGVTAADRMLVSGQIVDNVLRALVGIGLVSLTHICATLPALQAREQAKVESP